MSDQRFESVGPARAIQMMLDGKSLAILGESFNHLRQAEWALRRELLANHPDSIWMRLSERDELRLTSTSGTCVFVTPLLFGTRIKGQLDAVLISGNVPGRAIAQGVRAMWDRRGRFYWWVDQETD